ncbi:hypothetical protein [Rhizobium lusitanum]|uniref:hypothetical protein n=1 Tax=Rhizobium lusitanum TaxID=293958 RepID=UPI00114D1475|nr:hypothetical protein [Rhizobium lusitanum]
MTGQTTVDEMATTLASVGALADLISTLLQMTGAVVAKASLAELAAVAGSYHNGDIGLVLLDVDETKRGVYKLQAGAWVKIDDLPADIARAAVEAAEAFRDDAEVQKIAAEAFRDGAEVQKIAAEAARDIAAGYASDAVSQGNVPIFATLDGLSAIHVPIGINAIRLNGEAAAGDGHDGLFLASDTEPAADRKGQDANGKWWGLAPAGRSVGDILRYENLADIPTIYLDSKIIFHKANPTTLDGWDVRVFRDTSAVVGGTPGITNSALMVDSTAGASTTSIEWAFLAIMNNHSAAGENVAGYFQATKYGQGQTWSAVFETREDPSATYGALVSVEIDISANGPDPNNVRIGLDLIGARFNDNLAVPDIYAGLRITAAWNGTGAGVESARFMRPLLIDANWTDTAIFAYKREDLSATAPAKVSLLDMYVPDGANVNRMLTRFSKTANGAGWTTTSLYFDRLVDGATLVGRLGMNGDRSIELNTGLTKAYLKHQGGFVVPVYSVNPTLGSEGEVICVSNTGASVFQLRAYINGIWRNFAPS